MFSFDYDVDAKPSEQLRAMSQIHRPDSPFDKTQLEWVTHTTFEELCRQIDGPYITLKALGSLSLYLRCERRYLKTIHRDHRKYVLRISDKEAAAIAETQEHEEKIIRRSSGESRIRKLAIRRAAQGAWDNASFS